MEEEDDALSNGYKPPSPQPGDSTIGDEVLPHSTDQCDFVPELDDSELVGAASPAAVPEPEEEEDVEAMAGEGAEAEAEAGVEEADAGLEEVEAGVEVAEGVRGGGGRRKRGRNSRAPARAPPRKSFEEDVCFICFDGGDLVLCDRRGCPKAYHTSCVNRDEEFFRAKGKWNCGWHQCTGCQKNAYYMCLTCPYSLCKNCVKDSVLFCVRENKGFCEPCMRFIMLIENNEQGNKEMDQVDFDDKSSWEFLFKDYWIDLKGRLSLTAEELAQAKHPWKGSDAPANKQEALDETNDAHNDVGPGSDSSSENVEARKPKRRKAKKRLKSLNKERDSPSVATEIGAEGTSMPANAEWASKELLEFVMHMKNGERSVTSQFDVQALLLEYIKRNKLRDPRRKSQIICDSRLESLFGKPRVGHFEMLKLLESHFLNKEDSQADDLQGSVVDSEASQIDVDGNNDPLIKVGKDRRRKARKKGDERVSQSNLDDYAAIDIHNISLIYLRRNLMEDLLEDTEKLHEKVVGAFVRIRISGSGQKQDVYRLVQVVGTSKAGDPYKVGKRTTDVMLEILNLSKTEIISIDIISNQEFTEDECMRLRQSIKCGLIIPLTVGGILEKALALQAVRVKDWLDTEIVRLSHLRDRASEKGRRKELRECVEKLQRLKTTEERQRRLEEIPEVHADPNMDPSYESEEDESDTDDKRRGNLLRPRDTSFSRKRMEPSSSRKGDSGSNYSWSTPLRNSSRDWEFSRSMSNKGFSSKSEDVASPDEVTNEDSWNRRDRETQKLSRWGKISGSNSEIGSWNSHSAVQLESPLSSHSAVRSESFSGTALDRSVATHSVVKLESYSGTAIGSSSVPPLTGVEPTTARISETDKIWHYQDPAGKVQGPFSLVQLRKWSNSGYFPKDLRIWRTTEKQDESALLTDVLFSAFPKDASTVDNSFGKSQNLQTPHYPSIDSGKPNESSLQQVGQNQGGEKPNLDHRGENWRFQHEVSLSKVWAASSTVEASKVLTDGSVSDYDGRNDLANLPSPTPAQSNTGWIAGKDPDKRSMATEFPVQPATDPVAGSAGVLPSPTTMTSEIAQFVRSSSPSSVKQAASVDSSDVSFASFVQQASVPSIKGHNVIELLGALVPNSVSSSSASAPEVHPQLSVSGESQSVQADAHTLPVTDLAAGLTNPGTADSKIAGASLPNMVHSVAGHSHPVETHERGSGSISKPEIVASTPVSGGESQIWGYGPNQNLERNNSIPMHPQQPPYGHWVDASMHNPASSLGTGNMAGYFPSAGLGLPPSDSWRPQIPNNPPNFQPPPSGNQGTPALANLPSSVPPNMGPRAPSSFGSPAPTSLGHPNPPNLGHAPHPNMSSLPPPPPILTPSVPPNMISGAPPNLVPLGPPNLIPPGPPNLAQQPPSNLIPPAPAGMLPPATPNLAPPNPSWCMAVAENQSAAPRPGPQNQNAGWGPMPGNPNMTWGPVQGNPNMNWGTSGQVPGPGTGWVGTPTGNPGMWGSDQNHNVDRFSGQRDNRGGSQGGDSGYSGVRPWNRQTSFGNGGGGASGRSTPKSQKLCVYHESGHCKKGAACYYRHS